MAGNTLIQIKRTSVTGRAANTTTLPDPGSLAVNMTDQILYSTNGATVFEVGANVDIQTVRTALYVGDNVDLTTAALIIGNTSVNSSVNSTVFTGTANNASYLGGTAAADYQTEAGLAGNVATMSANNAAYLGGTAAAGYALDSDLDAYQTEAGLSANVATLTANNAAYLGGTAAADYQTEAGLAANVATMTANNATYFNTHADTYFANVTSPSFSTSVSVGANVIANTTAIFIGNTSVNLVATSTYLKLGNSSSNTTLSVPSGAAYSATNYFLHANGSWVQVTGGGSAPVYQAYTATGGQTTFTVSGGYTIGQIEVYVNGVKLAKDEYTENGATVVLDVGALVNSIVEVSGWIALASYEPVAAASNTYVQYNDSGPLGGSAGFTFDETTNNVVIANTLSVGANNIINTTAVGAGNAYFTGLVNAASHTSTNFTANTTGVYHTLVNSATFSVGALFTANATLVNCAAINLSGQINVGANSIISNSVISSGGSLLSANIQINAQSDNYTLAASDSGKVIPLANAAAKTITILAGLPVGFRCQVIMMGAGNVTISNTGQAGVTYFSRTGAFTVSTQYASASIVQPSANVYIIDGSV